MKPWIQILIGLVLGVFVGLFLGEPVPFLDHIGAAFINLLKMLVGIIIFSSIVTGICHINDPHKLSRIGLRTLLYYACSTIVAITIGLFFTFALRPGEGLALPLPNISAAYAEQSLLDFVFSIVPSNPVASFAEGNILQIIVFAILFAFAITVSKEKGKPVLHFFESIGEVMFALTHGIMRIAPLGVFALIATSVSAIGLKVIVPLLEFLACNYLACFVQVFVVFTLSLKFLAKVKAIPFFKGMKDAIVVAFTTNSSSATLPVSLECVRDHLGVSADISGFVLSLGSTINMNGAAVGQAVSAIFIAQAYGIEVTALKILILYVTSLISAIGAAGIPGTGIIMLSVVLGAMGLPIEGIALVAGVDRIREMVSSIVNILGDGVAAVYVAKKEKELNEKQYHAVTWLK